MAPFVERQTAHQMKYNFPFCGSPWIHPVHRTKTLPNAFSGCPLPTSAVFPVVPLFLLCCVVPSFVGSTVDMRRQSEGKALSKEEEYQLPVNYIRPSKSQRAVARFKPPPTVPKTRRTTVGAQSWSVTDTGCPRPGNSSQCSNSQHTIKLLCYIQLLRYNMVCTP